MTLCNLLQKRRIGTVSLAALFLLLSTQCKSAAAAQEQQQSQPPSQQQVSPPGAENQQATTKTVTPAPLAANQRKIWTNEDLIALRTPADIYLLEKEAKEAADAAAAVAKEAADREAAKAAAAQPPGIKLPETQEETEKMLQDNESNIQEQSAVLERLQNELANTPQDEQAGKQKEIDEVTDSLAKLKKDGKALEDHLRTFTEKTPTENPPSAPQPPSSF